MAPLPITTRRTTLAFFKHFTRFLVVAQRDEFRVTNGKHIFGSYVELLRDPNTLRRQL
jgi:hypothetical protein